MTRKAETARDQKLREHVLYVLRGGGAHLDFDSVIDDFPVDMISKTVPGVPYTAWQLLEHMRIVQWDIVEFSRDPKHVSPDWPDGCWPDNDVHPDRKVWKKSVAAFRADLEVMEELVEDPATDLFARIPHGTGQTILREALLIADHNAYHLGALVTLKRLIFKP